MCRPRLSLDRREAPSLSFLRKQEPSTRLSPGRREAGLAQAKPGEGNLRLSSDRREAPSLSFLRNQDPSTRLFSCGTDRLRPSRNRAWGSRGG